MESGASASAAVSHAEPVRGSRGSGWSPLRYASFRRWWLANLTSNVGSWMQTVAAQWLMTSLTTSAVLVGAIQATNLPVLLLAIPAGVLGDLLDRKQLILAGQLVMLVAAAALGVLDLAGAVTPAVLLVLLCGIGVGQGLTGPIAQTLQPELVPPEERPQAIALGSVNQNLARAIGPAIGGLLLAATSAAAVFFVNALSFVAVLVGGARGRARARLDAAARAPALGDSGRRPVRAQLAGAAGDHGPGRGLRLLRHRPVGAAAARRPQDARPRIRRLRRAARLRRDRRAARRDVLAGDSPRLTPGALMAACALAIAAATLVMAVSHSAVLDGAVLVLAGGGWILALGLLNASFQSALPSWVKARGMAFYTVAFQGALGVGALALGVVAQATSLKVGLIVLAAVSCSAAPRPSAAAAAARRDRRDAGRAMPLVVSRRARRGRCS